MTFKVLDQELGHKMRRRVLIIGGPNLRKTTSILDGVTGFPRPIGLLSYPGEKGSGVIPANDPGIKALIWEDDDPAKVSVAQQVNEVEKTTWEMLSGKFGEIKTFAGDGLHKLASLYWNREYQRLLVGSEVALANGKVTEDELKLRAYGNGNFGSTRDIMAYVSRVCQSNIHTVVFTCWEGREIDNPEATGKKTTHIFAELPGKLANLIVGEFGVVVYAEISLPDPQGKQFGTWQIRKAGKVWGVGVKTPPWIAAGLPERVPMDWPKLYALLAPEKEREKGEHHE